MRTKIHSSPTSLDCSLPSVFSYFYLIIKCTDGAHFHQETSPPPPHPHVLGTWLAPFFFCVHWTIEAVNSLLPAWLINWQKEVNEASTTYYFTNLEGGNNMVHFFVTMILFTSQVSNVNLQDRCLCIGSPRSLLFFPISFVLPFVSGMFLVFHWGRRKPQQHCKWSVDNRAAKIM